MTPHWLVSYHYYSDNDMREWVAKMYGGTTPARLFVDSGAPSVQSKGVTVSLKEYAAWSRKWAHLIGHTANLDVIGDAEGTFANQKALEALGMKPIPVYHAGEPWEYLERYLESYPYIALGGMMKDAARLKPWLVRCFRLAEGKAVYHGFGMTRWAIIRDFPFYSVDSSSWMSGYRYGSFPLFSRGQWDKVEMFSRDVWQHADLIKKHGITPQSVADRSVYHWTAPFRAGMTAWIRAGDWLRQRHGEIPLEGHESGPILYLAADAASKDKRRMQIAGEVAEAVA